MEEMLKLSKHYGLTLDQLFNDGIPLPSTLEVRIQLPTAKESDSRRKGQADTRKTLRKPRKK